VRGLNCTKLLGLRHRAPSTEIKWSAASQPLCPIICHPVDVFRDPAGYKHRSFYLQLVHELHAHADGNYIDWEDLEKQKATKTLSEDYLHFALASVGIKAARSLYRSRDSWQPLPFSEKLSSAYLLNLIETFAKEQCQFRLKRTVGYWNLGWVDTQKVRYHKVHGLIAAADCFANMTKAYHVADDEDNDFLKAAARIETAACLVMGSAGSVGYKIDGHTKLMTLTD
jgi:hypothetical protein